MNISPTSCLAAFRCISLAALTCLLAGRLDAGSTYYVDYELGTDDVSFGTGEGAAAWKTLKYAIESESVAAGDEIVLAKGTHQHVEAVVIDKALTIRGAGENWETVIDGREKNAALTISAAGTRIHNLTFARFGGNYGKMIVFNMTGEGVISNVAVTATCPNNYSAATTPVYANAGLITHCWITNNQCQGTAGVLLEGRAAMENCYVARNTRVGNWSYGTRDGIVEITSADVTLRNCTIVDNNLTGSGALACNKAAKVYNNLVWNNLDQGQPANLYLAGNPSTANWLANCTTPITALTGAGNTKENPLLKDDRMHISLASPCNGTANASVAPPDDIVGRARGATPSIGAFEYVDSGEIGVRMRTSATFVRQPTTITLSSELLGPVTMPVSYSWDFDGDGKPDLVTDSATAELTDVGVYHPVLTIVDDAGKTAAAELSDAVCIHPEGRATFQVDFAAGNDNNCGLDPEWPLKTLYAALQSPLLADGDEIVLKKGTHYLSRVCDVAKAVVVRGEGENWETVFDGQQTANNIIISAAGVRIHNLTFTRFGASFCSKIALNMTGEGVISNVVVTGTCPNSYSAATTPVYANAGLITHCWITNNQCQGTAGVLLEGTAAMENCYIARNTRVGPYAYGTRDGIVEITSANVTLRNCTIVDNNLTGSGALACNKAAKVCNNIIWNNLDQGQAVNLYLAGNPSTANWLANCTTPTTALTGAGNTADDPQLQDDRMHFKSRSPCRGKANADEAPAFDIEGAARGDAPSIGAFEYVDSGVLEAVLTSSATFVSLPETLTLTCTLDGQTPAPVRYSWDFDGDGDPDLVTDSATAELTDVGTYHPSVTVRDGAGKTVSAAFGTDLYVHPEGRATFHLDFQAGEDNVKFGLDPARPLKTLDFALRDPLLLDGDEIVLTKGTHDLSRACEVTKAVIVRGAGENWETVIDRQGQNAPITISAAGVKIHNLTFARFGADFSNPIVFKMQADGIISNVVVTGTCPRTANGSTTPVYAEAGLITHCWITNNQCQGTAGVGLAGTATMENSYLAGNTRVGAYSTAVKNGIVEITSADVTLRNCTIIDNNLTGSGALACNKAAKVYNNLIWNNLDQGRAVNLYLTGSPSTANWLANCTTPIDALTGAGNIADDPQLQDDRMHFKSRSPCRGKANADEAPVFDIEGAARGDAPSIGAFEYVDSGKLEVSIENSAFFVSQPDGITLTCTLAGPVAEPVRYAWDFNGDGVTDSTEATARLTEVGVYRPSLTVRDATDATATAFFDTDLYIHPAGPATFHVDFQAGEDDSGWGLDPARPLKTLDFALLDPLLLDGDEIVLEKGTHYLSELSEATKRVVIRGAGECWETVIDGQERNASLTISTAGVRVHNLTFSRFGGNFGKMIVFNMVADGIISNVVVTGTCPTTYNSSTTPVYAEAGLITHCRIVGNQCQGTAGVELAGTATMENCYIARNTRVAVYAIGLQHVGIVNIVSKDVTLRNCTIVDNELLGSGALACKAPARVLNNIIWNNHDFEQDLIANLYFENNPSTANWLANCTCPTNGLAGAGNVEGDPLLKDDRMRLFADSPCRDAGDDTLVAPGETDLRGHPRKVGRHVDIGCLEYRGGLSVLVR